MIQLVLIGFLSVLGLSLIVLDSAIEHACDGHEDGNGFHQDPPSWGDYLPSGNSGLTLFDHLEGACCPLDMAPVFRPLTNHSHFNSPR